MSKIKPDLWAHTVAAMVWFIARRTNTHRIPMAFILDPLARQREST